MYIFERLFGVLIYSIGLFFAYYAITKKASLKKVLIGYLVFLVVLAFIYIPGDNADLIRLRLWINEIVGMTNAQFSSSLNNTSIPLFYLFARFLGSIDMQGLIPAIAALVSYSCGFYMLYKASRSFDLNHRDIAISLLVFMSCGQYLQLISDVRSQMVFFIVAALTFREIVLKKNFFLHIPIYISCALFHSSAIALVGIRLFLGLFSMKGKKITYKLMYLIVLAATILIVTKEGGIILSSFYEKTNRYLAGGNYSYIWTFITSWISLIISMTIILRLKGVKNQNSAIANFAKYCLCFNIITIAFSFEYNIFIRFQAYSEVLNLALYPLLLSNLDEKKKIATRKALGLAAIVLLTISCTRGDLSGYKFLKLN